MSVFVNRLVGKIEKINQLKKILHLLIDCNG